MDNYQIIIIVQTEGGYLSLDDQGLFLQLKEGLELLHYV